MKKTRITKVFSAELVSALLLFSLMLPMLPAVILLFKGDISLCLINYNEQIDYRCKITEAGLYQCLYCSAKLANSAQFQNHVAERHKTMYQCKHCDMNFYRSQDLAIHCRIHSLVSPFPWNYCNAHFSRAMPLLAVHEIFYYSEHIYKSDFRLHLKKV
jgi:hypothetical protein